MATTPNSWGSSLCAATIRWDISSYMAPILWQVSWAITAECLPVFQVANGLVAGLTVALFFISLVFLLKTSWLTALGFSVLFGASYNFWFYAGTGDIYVLSILFLLLAWLVLIYEVIWQPRRFLFLSGGLIGLAVLSHQLNAVLLPVAVALILLRSPQHEHERDKNIKASQILTLLVSAGVVACLGYLILGYIAIAPFSIPKLLLWIKGYLGDPTYGNPIDETHLTIAWSTAKQTILGLGLNAPWITNGLLFLLLSILVAGLWTYRSLDKNKQILLMVCGAQCIIIWSLILWWEPQNPKFWLLTLVPLLTLFAISFEALENKVKVWLHTFNDKRIQMMRCLPLLLGLMIFSANLPLLRMQHNAHTQESLAFHRALDAWLQHSRPGDVLITAGDLVPPLIFWGNRPDTIYVYRSLQRSASSGNPFQEMRDQIRRTLCNGNSLLVAPEAGTYMPDELLSIVHVSHQELHAFLQSYAERGEIAFWYVNLIDHKSLPVYRLTQAEACP